MDRPIIFSAPMVRALLDGRKTQTRRVIKPQPEWLSGAWYWTSPRYNNGDGARYFHTVDVSGVMPAWLRALPYAPGDRLWVREAWAKDDMILSGTRYYATDDVHPLRRKRPSIHMPRWASRLTLTVTDVRVQRVQDISEADARAEGIVREDDGYSVDGMSTFYAPTARGTFRHLWADLHGGRWDAIRGKAWDANPWVAALTFTVEPANIDALKAAA